jgi:hypothetical protein
MPCDTAAGRCGSKGSGYGPTTTSLIWITGVMLV